MANEKVTSDPITVGFKRVGKTGGIMVESSQREVPELDSDLAKFESTVRILASCRSKESYLSLGKDRAAVVVENILLNSSKHVRMIVGNFNQEVFSRPNRVISDALEQFLLNEGKITVILDDYDLEKKPENGILKLLKQFSTFESYNQNIDVRTIDYKFKLNDSETHFTIGDPHMYRLEYDTARFHAKFCFNDKARYNQLQSSFTTALTKSQKLDLNLLPY